MPKVGSVGVSKETRFKQHDFYNIMDIHMNCVQSILGKHGWTYPAYCYLDLNAGPGSYSDPQGHRIVGSPLLTLELASDKGLPLIGALCEHDPTEHNRLAFSLITESHCTQFPHDPWSFSANNGQQILQVYPQDYRQAWPAVSAQFSALQPPCLYGLLYSDENAKVPPFDLFASWAQRFPLIDILIYLSAASIKRVFYAPHTPLQHRLDALIAGIDKKYWLIRDPSGKHQWTFLVGTNWKDMKPFRKGFYSIATPKGADILHQLSVNAKEYHPLEMPYEQLSLFTPRAARPR